MTKDKIMESQGAQCKQPWEWKGAKMPLTPVQWDISSHEVHGLGPLRSVLGPGGGCRPFYVSIHWPWASLVMIMVTANCCLPAQFSCSLYQEGLVGLCHSFLVCETRVPSCWRENVLYDRSSPRGGRVLEGGGAHNWYVQLSFLWGYAHPFLTLFLLLET